MSLTVSLPPELENRIRSEAAAKGISLDAYVMERLTRHAPPPTVHKPLSPEEAERLWDEMVESLPDMPVLTDEQLSRECIYADEEER